MANVHDSINYLVNLLTPLSAPRIIFGRLTVGKSSWRRLRWQSCAMSRTMGRKLKLLPLVLHHLLMVEPHGCVDAVFREQARCGPLAGIDAYRRVTTGDAGIDRREYRTGFHLCL